MERLRVAELKQLCRENGLKVGGRKAELIERLHSALGDAEEHAVAGSAVEDHDEMEAEEGGDASDATERMWGTLVGSMRDDGWKELLRDEFEADYFHNICAYLAAERRFFPPADEVFAAFNHATLDNVKAVIIGQDPYHNDGQAHGLCFSVKKGVKVPPSLRTMYKELENDIPGFRSPSHGCLTKWAQQGVLMLNAALTVYPHKANSHKAIGWHQFTDAVIELVNERCSGIVFLLWGQFAWKKCRMVDEERHHVLRCAHPSPMAGGAFYGSRCFSACNELLREQGKPEIDWKL